MAIYESATRIHAVTFTEPFPLYILQRPSGSILASVWGPSVNYNKVHLLVLCCQPSPTGLGSFPHPYRMLHHLDLDLPGRKVRTCMVRVSLSASKRT